ncbi:MAG: hypothetical protein DI536_05145, partial [Archangium gephyra]
PLGYVPPVEFEQMYYRQQMSPAMVAWLTFNTLRETRADSLFVGCGTVSQPVDDGGIADAGVADAGAPAAGARDAGSPDGGATDAGQADAGVADAGEVFDGGSPCDLANGGCDPLTTCDDTDSGVTCSPCPAGYVGAGASGCVNVDECAPDGGASCGLRTCIDTPGAYQCGACIGGYTDDGGTCVDIDECALDAGVCHRLTTCTNSVGDFSCSACPGPYATGNGRGGLRTTRSVREVRPPPLGAVDQSVHRVGARAPHQLRRRLDHRQRHRERGRQLRPDRQRQRRRHASRRRDRHRQRHDRIELDHPLLRSWHRLRHRHHAERLQRHLDEQWARGLHDALLPGRLRRRLRGAA